METECQGTTVVDNKTEGRGNSCSHLVKARETERLEKVKVKQEVHLVVEKEQQLQQEEEEEGLWHSKATQEGQEAKQKKLDDDGVEIGHPLKWDL